MASIVKRKNSYSVVYNDSNTGKQIWESGYNHADAKDRKAAVEFEQSQERSGEIRAIPIKTYMDEFIEKYGSKKWGTSYFSANLGLLKNYVYPYWGETPIHKFSLKGVDDFYDHLTKHCTMTGTGREKEKVTPSLINDIHKLMRCAFNQAKKWQYVSVNPFLDATLPEHKMKVRPALTPAQLEEIFLYTDNMDQYDLYLIHTAMNLAFAGSMRGGEIGGLQWSDIVDSENRILHISKAIDRVPKKVLEKVSKTEIFFKFPNLFPGCKTVVVLKNTKEYGGSDRNCYLPEAVYEKLINLKSLQCNMKEELGDDGYVDYGLIICQANGRPIMTEHLNKRFQAILNELGIKPQGLKDGENFVFHSIRSTATTYKLRVSGGDIKAVQGENGQKDPKMVTHQYSRILDEDRRRISKKLDDEFYGKKAVETIPDTGKITEVLAFLQNNPAVFSDLLTHANTR